MTTTVAVPRGIIIGNGTRGPFQIVDNNGSPVYLASASHLRLIRRETTSDAAGSTLSYPIEYSVSGAPGTGCTFTLEDGIDVLAVTERIEWERVEPHSQELSISKGGNFSSADVVAALDDLSRQVQDVSQRTERSLKQYWNDTTSLKMAVPVSTRAGKLAAYDTSGNFIASSVDDNNVAQILAMEADIALIADDLANGDESTVRALAGAIEAGELGPLVSVKSYGAKGDAIYGTTGAATATSTTFTDATPTQNFTSAMVGKLIRIEGAGTGGGFHVTTIAAVVDQNTLTLTTAAVTTVSSAAYVYGTDDTDAIDNAYEYTKNFTIQRYPYDAQRNIISIANAMVLYFPGGHYLYNGDGLVPDTANSRILKILGDGSSNTILEICSDVYLVDCPEAWTHAFNFFHCEGLKVCSGKGLFMNRATYDNELGGTGGGVPQAGYYVHDVRVLDFTECGFCSYWEGTANWKITSCWFETTRPDTKGIMIGPLVANPDLTATTIVGCTYKIVVIPVGPSGSIIQGLSYLHSLAADDHEADIWLMTVDPLVQGYVSTGQIMITDNRFSNENRGIKPVILIADSDDGGDPDTPLHLRSHSTSNSTLLFRDLVVHGNYITGNNDPDTAGPFLKSYTADLGQLVIWHNSFGNGFTYLCELTTAPTAGYISDMILGPNLYHSGSVGEKPTACNYSIGIWRDPYGEEIPSAGTPLSGSGGYDPNYHLMSVASSNPVDEDELTLAGSVTRTVVTDALGGTNAYEYTFTAANTVDYINIPVGSVDADPYGCGYVEFDAKTASSRAMTRVDVELKPTISGGGETIRREIILTGEWLPVRIPFNANGTLVSCTVRFYASPDDFSAGVRDKVQIGRPHVYRANRPVNRDHLYIANHKWNAGREYWRGPETSQFISRWYDWTNGVFRQKAGTPSSETDGTVLALEPASYSSTDLGDAANAVNTSGKREGKKVWNTTTKKEYRSSGSAAADPWEPVDGSTAITPS